MNKKLLNDREWRLSTAWMAIDRKKNRLKQPKLKSPWLFIYLMFVFFLFVLLVVTNN